MKNICVFCGSRLSHHPLYTEIARELAYAFVKKNLGLVYGGADVGLMGVLSNSMLEQGGHVIGVMPQSLVDREVANRRLSDLRIVNTMHERKALMASLSDAFILMPGGIGSMDEFFEIWTWKQLQLHQKPIGVLNPGGYFDPLFDFIDRAVSQDFVAVQTRDDIVIENDDPLKLLNHLI